MTHPSVEDTLSQDLSRTLNLTELTPLSPEVIQRQATVNIGTIGHVAHGKSTVVKAISGVQTVRFKNELERNITIKLGYANAKVSYYYIDIENIFLILLDLQVYELGLPASWLLPFLQERQGGQSSVRTTWLHG